MLDRAKTAAILLAFAALFGFLVFQAGVASNYHQPHNQLTSSAEHAEERNILVRFWEWTTDDPVAVYTLVLAFSTIGLWSVTARGVRTQIADTRILQRAYVSVEPLGLSLLIDGGHLLGLVSIKNAGNLPARNLNWSIRMVASHSGEMESFPLNETKGNIVVAPHSETTRGSDGRLVLQDMLTMADAGSGRLSERPVFIYVYGKVCYHDGFTDGRTTKFCHRYNWKVRPQEPGRYEMSKELARQHTHGNESD